MNNERITNKIMNAFMNEKVNSNTNTIQFFNSIQIVSTESFIDIEFKLEEVDYHIQFNQKAMSYLVDDVLHRCVFHDDELYVYKPADSLIELDEFFEKLKDLYLEYSSNELTPIEEGEGYVIY